ncbi:hypothetical protein LZ012_01400 [Dechloromonas sp. XY25]|uniref:FecR protein domain-containing protein n=1 Tax=Dechloromonas hankyongensis TaxID=2908002 RepID=A0ABS9JXL4_9RHOO|nr:DUF6600 domain-containing protein [Dechloromonas hankyongensis]MCG2575645.1 hypothetical protein [Dechloromonas hankyongensis]
MLKSVHRIFLAAIVLLALPALAQSDPPSRVGRVSYLDGEVGFRVDRREEGGPATLNWPVSSGAVLESGRQGRAEVWIGSTAYRLSGDSQVEFPLIDDRRVDARLNGGSLAVSVLDRDQADDALVTTPDGTVRFLTPGRYRLNVYADRSELVVQAGRATFDNGQRVIPVAAGQMAVLGSDGSEQLEGAPRYDAFDQWVANRENASLAGPARRYVSPYMTGYQDLDAYGDWRNTSDYGTVWYPRGLASDWAPYRYGRWAWVAPWGWTWIDQSPWGFAPFHYGRWAMIGGRWGWVPGRLVPRPVYAPALVGWVGNPGWSVSFSFGSSPAVGWFPLAPREVYVPAYRYSPNYVRQINVTQVNNVTIIDRAVRNTTPTYAYRALPQAVTVVPANHLREGRPISRSELRQADRRNLDRAPQARQAPTAQWLAPAAAATRPHEGDRGASRPPRSEFTSPRPNDRERGPSRFESRDNDRRPPVENRARPSENQPLRQDIPAMDSRRGQPEMGRDAIPESRRDNRRGPDAAPETRSGVRSEPGAAAVRPEAGREMNRETNRDANRDANESRREFFRRHGEGGDGRPGAETNAPRRDDRAQPLVAPQEREPRRDMRDTRDTPAPVRRETPPDMRREERPQPSFQAPEREQRRDMRDLPRSERQQPAPAAAQVMPQREMQRLPEAMPAPPRRETPPEMRREERPRPSFQVQERREMPREMPREVPREMPRMERPVQQAAPVAPPPQREMPRPAPEVRMPAPQPAPPPPQAEPPRQQPAPQGGNEQHRHRDEERGPR